MLLMPCSRTLNPLSSGRSEAGRAAAAPRWACSAESLNGFLHAHLAQFLLGDWTTLDCHLLPQIVAAAPATEDAVTHAQSGPECRKYFSERAEVYSSLLNASDCF